jgi:hypothetical protein
MNYNLGIRQILTLYNTGFSRSESKTGIALISGSRTEYQCRSTSKSGARSRRRSGTGSRSASKWSAQVTKSGSESGDVHGSGSGSGSGLRG